MTLLKWRSTPVLLPGKSHGWRSLVGCSPWGHEESDTTERLLFHFSLSCIGEGNGNPLQCSCLENPRDGGAWWAAISGVTQSWTRLKQLSSSSSSISLVVFKIFLKKYFSVIFLVWLSWYLSFDFANLHKPLNGHLPGDLKFFAIVSANILPHSLSHLLWFSLQVY